MASDPTTLISFSSFSSCILSIISLIYVVFFRTSPWECMEKKTVSGQYIIGRINFGESECLYDPVFPGCYVIDEQATTTASARKRRAEQRCKNIINTKPNVTDMGEKYTIQTYTCGNGGTNYQLWGTTGYDDPNSDCSLIQEKTNILNKI